MASPRWLLLVHQLPAKPAYSRVKIWRRLQEVGAISVKNAVYVLPASEKAHAHLARILREIERHGGDGLLYEADLAAGMRDDQLRALFNAARDADYQTVTAELRRLEQGWKKSKKPKNDPERPLPGWLSACPKWAKLIFSALQAGLPLKPCSPDWNIAQSSVPTTRRRNRLGSALLT